MKQLCRHQHSCSLSVETVLVEWAGCSWNTLAVLWCHTWQWRGIGASSSRTHFLTSIHCFKSASDRFSWRCMKSNTPYTTGMFDHVDWNMFRAVSVDDIEAYSDTEYKKQASYNLRKSEHAHSNCFFTNIFNLSLSLSMVPSCFKKSTSVPIPKKNKITCLNDWRPVTLTPIFRKCFEKLIRDYICSVLPASLDLLKFAFCSNHSTDNAIAFTLLSPTWKIRTPMWECCSWTKVQHLSP